MRGGGTPLGHGWINLGRNAEAAGACRNLLLGIPDYTDLDSITVVGDMLYPHLTNNKKEEFFPIEVECGDDQVTFQTDKGDTFTFKLNDLEYKEN